MACEDCHAPVAEPAVLYGNETRLSFRLSAEGSLLDDLSSAEAELAKHLAGEGFVLTGEEESELKILFELAFEEVEDSLIPAESKILLYRGECRVAIRDRKEPVWDSVVVSKVTSGKDRRAIQKDIADYLVGEGLVRGGLELARIVELR